MAVCECGCGTEIRSGTRFAHGHNRRGTTRSAETLAKASASMRGFRHTEEAKARMRTAVRVFKEPMPPEVRAKHGDALRGRPKSKEHRAKLADANRGKRTGDANPMRRPDIAALFKGDANAMRRPEVAALHRGDRNPMKRPEVRAKVGRALAGPVRHHVNRDRSDNSDSNIHVFPNHAEHLRYHAWARRGAFAVNRGSLATWLTERKG